MVRTLLGAMLALCGANKRDANIWRENTTDGSRLVDNFYACINCAAFDRLGRIHSRVKLRSSGGDAHLETHQWVGVFSSSGDASHHALYRETTFLAASAARGISCHRHDAGVCSFLWSAQQVSSNLRR